MLKLRLKQLGCKKKHLYKIIASKALNKQQGKTVATFGIYNPYTKKLILNFEKFYAFLKLGAQPTKRIYKIIKQSIIF